MSELKWYTDIDYESAKELLKSNMQNVTRSFVAVGYYLKYIRDTEGYRQDGFGNIWEFAEQAYGLQRSTASRWMAINDRFSKDGNSPVLAEEYREFGKSQLQEMLYLTNEQAREVAPDMTVKEIREIRKQEDAPEATQDCREEQMPEPGPAKCITGASGSGICGAAAYCEEPVECCAECLKDCNGRCGWIDDLRNHVEHQELCATSHMEEVPDAAWFIREYLKRYGDREFPELMRICRENPRMTDKVKAIKNYLGYSGGGSSDFGYSFGSTSQGVNFDAYDWAKEIQMSWSQFVRELEKIYDPWDEKWNSDDRMENEPTKVDSEPGDSGAGATGEVTAAEPVEHDSSVVQKVIWPEFLEDMPVFSRTPIVDILYDAETELREVLACEGLPDRYVLNVQMKVAGLRLLKDLVERLEE